MRGNHCLFCFLRRRRTKERGRILCIPRRNRIEEKMIEMLSQMVKGEKEGSLLLSFCKQTKQIERGRGNGSEEQRGRE